MRVGILGCGYWGSKHVRVLSALAGVDRVIAIDQDSMRLAAMRRTMPSIETAVDLDGAIDSVDAVVVATPPRTHASIALDLIRAGKSVLVEKPLATSVEDAEAMVGTARDEGVVLMVGHTFEYNAAVWKLRELVADDELGELYYLDSARLNLGLYQTDVNVIWDLAPHDVSILNYVLGSTPTTVQAWGARHAHLFLEDVAYLRLTYGRIGVSANVHVSWLDPCKVRRVTAVGSKKMAVYNDLSTEERIRVFDKGVVAPEEGGAVGAIPMSYRYGEIRSPFVSFEEPLAVQDRHFLSCVLGESSPMTPGESGLAVVRTLACAERSLLEGRPVDIPQEQEQERVASTAGRAS